MTKRHLLFDSGCAVCTGLAQKIAQAAEGWLTAESLRSPAMQAQLDRAAPGWAWEPLLLEIEGEEVRVLRGVAMRLHILAALGPRRTWQIAKLVQQASHAFERADQGRRGFPQSNAAITAGLLLGITSAPAAARETADAGSSALGKPTLLQGEEAAELRRRALKSRDVMNLLATATIDSETADVYLYATPQGDADWSVTFPVVGGGTIAYLYRAKAQIRTQAIHQMDDVFIAYSVDGLRSRTENLALVRAPGEEAAAAQLFTCTEPGCGTQFMDFCERCCRTCSGYRTVEKNCCVCRYPGGDMIVGCMVAAYGPCGIC
ncbi:hypothetical protein ACMHYB_39210 [Sorangium sp. So ce1128]